MLWTDLLAFRAGSRGADMPTDRQRVGGGVLERPTRRSGAGAQYSRGPYFAGDSALQRELCAGVVGLGVRIGWDRPAVSRFARLVAGRTLECCRRADLERVLLGYLELVLRVRARAVAANGLAEPPSVARRRLDDGTANVTPCSDSCDGPVED